MRSTHQTILDMTALFLACLSCACGGQAGGDTSEPAATNQGVFTLSSDAGSDGGELPADYTCDGSGASPSLSWSNTPAGTREFALIMSTITVDGETKYNWVLYSIPVSARSLVRDSTGIGTEGAGSNGSTLAYEPPCSQGPGPKLYTFTLYALSGSPRLPDQAYQVTGNVLAEAVSSLTLGSASLNLSYTRP